MTTETTTAIADRVQSLHEYIAAGRILDAMQEFYSEDVLMQDNLEEPCRGLGANLDREKAWLDTVAEWKGFEVKAIAIVGNTSFAETAMDFVTADGQEIHQEQVSRAVWKNGHIVDERFYHA